MKTGPKPEPTDLLKLKGSYRPSKHAGRMDATKVSGKPIKPDDLDAVGGKLWDEIVAEHESRVTLGSIDTAALTSLCECWSLYRKALAVAKGDPTDKDARCSTLAYLAQCDKLGSKFGWTASDRASIKTGSSEITSPVAAFSRKRA